MSKLHASINFSLRKKELQANQAEFLDLNAKAVGTELEQNFQTYKYWMVILQKFYNKILISADWKRLSK
jgi:hypothetical protein